MQFVRDAASQALKGKDPQQVGAAVDATVRGGFPPAAAENLANQGVAPSMLKTFWDSLDDGQKVAVLIGLPLGLVGMLQTFAGGNSTLGWLLTALGLGTAVSAVGGLGSTAAGLTSTLFSTPGQWLFGGGAPQTGAQRPGTAGAQQPGPAGAQRPGTAGAQQPGPAGAQQPVAAGAQQPGAPGTAGKISQQDMLTDLMNFIQMPPEARAAKFKEVWANPNLKPEYREGIRQIHRMARTPGERDMAAYIVAQTTGMPIESATELVKALSTLPETYLNHLPGTPTGA